MKRSRLYVAGALALLLAGRAVNAADLSAAKSLYASASYEEALTMLSSLEAGENFEQVHQLRALCLLALGRTREGEETIERLVLHNPTAAAGWSWVPFAEHKDSRLSGGTEGLARTSTNRSGTHDSTKRSVSAPDKGADGSTLTIPCRQDSRCSPSRRPYWLLSTSASHAACRSNVRSRRTRSRSSRRVATRWTTPRAWSSPKRPRS